MNAWNEQLGDGWSPMSMVDEDPYAEARLPTTSDRPKAKARPPVNRKGKAAFDKAGSQKGVEIHSGKGGK